MGKDLAKIRGEMDRTVNSLMLCDEVIVAVKRKSACLHLCSSLHKWCTYR